MPSLKWFSDFFIVNNDINKQAYYMNKHGGDNQKTW
jgi:hypothetical protein